MDFSFHFSSFIHWIVCVLANLDFIFEFWSSFSAAQNGRLCPDAFELFGALYMYISDAFTDFLRRNKRTTSVYTWRCLSRLYYLTSHIFTSYKLWGKKKKLCTSISFYYFTAWLFSKITPAHCLRFLFFFFSSFIILIKSDIEAGAKFIAWP